LHARLDISSRSTEEAGNTTSTNVAAASSLHSKAPFD
jgi:hypothetical protein